MANVDKNLFDYLTKQDNFRSFYDLHRLLPQISEQLHEEFWRSCVYNQLADIIENNEYGFNVSIDENDPTYKQIKLFKKGWRDLCVCFEFKGSIGQSWEQIYCAIPWDKKHYNENQLNDICNKFNENLKLSSFNLDKNSKWLSWKYIGYLYNDETTLYKILPEIRDSYARELAELLWEFAKEVNELCDNIFSVRIANI